jgi:hypothetical protein
MGLGPALIPGLMAAGLIVLVLGSIWILGEKLGAAEIAAIALLVLSITLLGLSRLSTLPVIAMFVAGSAILVVTNMYGIAKIQLAFRVTNASLAIPIQQIPIQTAPALVSLAVGLIIASTFLLARRQGMMEGA